MSEMAEEPAVVEQPNLTELVQEALTAAFNTAQAELGAQLVGDWVFVAEVHTGDGTYLRTGSSESLPTWRRMGLLTFAAEDLKQDLLIANGFLGDECE